MIKFTQITRTIDPKTRIHYLDAIDADGQHWMAQMTHQEEPWLCYSQTWQLDLQQPKCSPRSSYSSSVQS